MSRIIQIAGIAMILFSLLVMAIENIPLTKNKVGFITAISLKLWIILPIGIFLLLLTLSNFMVALIITIIITIILKIGGLI